MKTKKKLILLTALLSCGLLVAQSSPRDIPAEPGPEEKITPMSIPNDPYVIDSEIKRLKALKQGLIGREYIADEDAMRVGQQAATPPADIGPACVKYDNRRVGALENVHPVLGVDSHIGHVAQLHPGWQFAPRALHG